MAAVVLEEEEDGSIAAEERTRHYLGCRQGDELAWRVLCKKAGGMYIRRRLCGQSESSLALLWTASGIYNQCCFDDWKETSWLAPKLAVMYDMYIRRRFYGLLGRGLPWLDLEGGQAGCCYRRGRITIMRTPLTREEPEILFCYDSRGVCRLCRDDVVVYNGSWVTVMI